jgi:hypothetical protein
MRVNPPQASSQSVVLAKEDSVNRGETRLVAVAFVAGDETGVLWGGSAVLLLIALRQGFTARLR